MREIRRPRSLDVATCYAIPPTTTTTTHHYDNYTATNNASSQRGGVAVVLVNVRGNNNNNGSRKSRGRRKTRKSGSGGYRNLRPYTWGPNGRRFLEQISFFAAALQYDDDDVIVTPDEALDEGEVIPSPVVPKKFKRKSDSSSTRQHVADFRCESIGEEALPVPTIMPPLPAALLTTVSGADVTSEAVDDVFADDDDRTCDEEVGDVMESLLDSVTSSVGEHPEVEDDVDEPGPEVCDAEDHVDVSTTTEVVSVLTEMLDDICGRPEVKEVDRMLLSDVAAAAAGIHDKSQNTTLTPSSKDAEGHTIFQYEISPPTIQDLHAADLFSEEHEMALERAKGVRRQDTFAPHRSNRRDPKKRSSSSSSSSRLRSRSDFNLTASLCDVTSEDGGMGMILSGDDVKSGRSLKIFSVQSDEEDGSRAGFLMLPPGDSHSASDSSKRGSSATSSDTVVASSDEDLQKRLKLFNSSLKRKVLGLIKVTGGGGGGGGGGGTKKWSSVYRSRSWDRFRYLRVTSTGKPDFMTSSPKRRERLMTSPAAEHVGMAESSPVITVTADRMRKNSKKNGGGGSSPKLTRRIRARSFVSLWSSGKASNPISGLFSTSSSVSSSSPPYTPPGSPKNLRPGSFRLKQTSAERERKASERQAAEACRWLRSAGFPQYAHLYEAGGFPLDVDDVNVDHDFLNKDQIAAIVRRLTILNKCASMKLDRTTQPSSKHFVSSSTNITETDDDEEEECAISNVWRLDVDSTSEAGRWSRLNSAATSAPHEDESSGGSLTSPGSDAPSQFTASEDVFALAMSDNQLSVKLDDYKSSVSSSAVSSKPPSVAGDKKNKFNKSHSFLKKVGSDLRKLRSGSFRRKDGGAKEAFKKSSLVIGDPILTSGLDRVNQMRCVAIEGSAVDAEAERKSSSNSLISTSSSSGGASSSGGMFKQLSADPFLFQPSLSSAATAASKPRAFSSDNVFLTPSNHIPGTFPISIREPSDSAAAATTAETPRSAMASSSSSSSSSSSTSSSTRHDSESSSSAGGETGGGGESSTTLLKPLGRGGNLIRPLSIYDNLSNDDGATTEELLDLLQSPTPHHAGAGGRLDSRSLFGGSREQLGEHRRNGATPKRGAAELLWGYDDIVNASNHLQHMVKSWEEDLEVNDDVTTSGSRGEPKQQLFLLPTANYKPTLPSYNQNAAKSPKDVGGGKTEDGGSKKQRAGFCWKNFKTDHLRHNSASNVDSSSGHLTKLTYIHELSVGQLMMLRRLSLLKLTAHMESYAMPNNKNSSWSMPRFIRKVKNPEYKDKSVFGIPLLYNVRKTGQPIPPCILQALAYLRRSALTQKGIFRKPGVRSRIAKLRCGCETNGKFAFYDDCSPYDVADMVKQYFRELPDPLMTSKMNDTFVGIFMHVPEHLRLPALQAAVMLLPDENREALMTLLCFLSDVTAEREENQMTPSNLATCFAPSLFCFQPSRATQSTVSPKTRKQQSSKSANHNFAARMDQKERDENVVANTCISFMIENVNHLFVLPEDTMTQCRISVMQQIDDVLAAEIGYSTPEVIDASAGSDFLSEFHAYVGRMVAQGVRDEQRTTQSRSNNGWQNTLSPSGCELTCKKVNDGNPLRLWKCKVDGVKATVKRTVERILHERQIWDDELSEWKVIQQPDERTQLFQIVTSEMPPHPSRDFCLLRSWRNDVTPAGGSAIVEVSAGQNVPLLGDVRGVMLTSRYLIEPAPGAADECSVTRVCRVDLKGRNPEWYNKTYGHIVARQLFRIRESFATTATS